MPQCYQSKIINAPIEKVWDTIKCFHSLDWAPNVVNSTEKVGVIKGNKVGAKRILNEAFHETLVDFCELGHTFSYSIDEGVSPVSSKEVHNYVGVIKLYAITLSNETLIEWKSSWDANTQEAEEFCHLLYVAMMNDLNIHMKEVA